MRRWQLVLWIGWLASSQGVSNAWERTDSFGDPLPPGAVQRIGTLRMNHGSYITALAVSDDGRRVASTGGRSPLRVWDRNTGGTVASIPFPPAEILVMAFSPDGTRLAWGGFSDDVQVFSFDSGTKQTLSGHNHRVESLAFSSDGNLLATADDNWNLKFWDLTKGEMVSSHHLESSVRKLAFSKDGQWLLVQTHEKGLFLWDRGQAKLNLFCDEKELFDAALSPDSALIVGAYRKGIVVWNAVTGKPIASWPTGNPNTPVSFLRVTKSGQIMAINTQGVWSQFDASGTLLRKRQVAPDFNHSWAANTDGSVIVWGTSFIHGLDTEKDEPINPALDRATPSTFELSDVTITGDGQRILTAGDRGIEMWNCHTARKVRTLSSSDKIESITLSADEKRIFGQTNQCRAVSWDLKTGQRTLDTDLPTHARMAIGRDHNNGLLAYGSYTRALGSLYDVQKSQTVRTLNGDSPYRSDRRYFFTDLNSLIRLTWPMASETLVKEWNLNDGTMQEASFPYRFSEMAVTRDRSVAALSMGDEVLLMELSTHAEFLRLKGHSSSISALAFSADGNTLVSSAADSTALVWDISLAAMAGKEGAFTAPDLWKKISQHNEPYDGFFAMNQLVRMGDEATQFLGTVLAPTPTAAAEQMERLVSQLDDHRFPVRERASRELAKLGRQIREPLLSALQKTPSAEATSRINDRLAFIRNPLQENVADLETIRAIWVLERIQTKAAQSVLKRLASGAPSARTDAAKAALSRRETVSRY